MLPVISPGSSHHSPDMQRFPAPSFDVSYVTPRKKLKAGASPRNKMPKTLRLFYPSKDSLTPLPAWTEEAIERRLKGFDDVMQLMNKQMEGTTFNHQFLKDTIESQRDQCMFADLVIGDEANINR